MKSTESTWIKMLSDTEVEKINEQSLEILETTGILVDHEGGLKLLEKAGAKVDHQTKRVRISRALVAQCLKTVPDHFTLAGRDPQKDCPLVRGGRPYARNGGGADFTLDPETGEFRPMMLADLKNYYRLMDGLSGINFIAPVFGQDMPVAGRDIMMLREAFNGTSKNIHLRAFSGKTLKIMFEMAALVAGGKEALKKRPLVSLLEAPVSPLKFLDVTVDALFLCGEYGIPLDVCVMPIAGGTGPVTMAGNVQLLNTEFLGGVVISQLANPGAPLQYAPRPMAMDMQTGFSLAGSVELGMMAVAGAQMAHYYNVPVSLHGPWTDAMTHDGQSTFERTYMTLMAGFAGANVLVGAGMMQQSLVTSYEQMVIDSEINNTVVRALQGFDVDEGHLAMEAITRIGPGGNFIQDAHTLKYLRGERYRPSPLIFRGSRDGWMDQGAQTFEKRAMEIAKSILKEHEVLPLPEDISQELDKLVSSSMKSLKK